MKKIFFTDLDGTLLTDAKLISPKTREALDNWMNKGNILALSSGRPLESIKEVMLQNNLRQKNVYLIAFNGALIYDAFNDKIINSKDLSLNLVREISNLANLSHVYCHTYNMTHIITPKAGAELKMYTKTIHLPYIELDNFPEGIKTPPCKMLCIDISENNRLSEFGEMLMKKFPGQLTCLKSNPHLLEIFSSNSGKGNAVKDLAKILNIPITDTIAAGDEENDLSMLTEAGVSLAMKNGNDKLKNIATFVTKSDNNSDGLVYFLESLSVD